MTRTRTLLQVIAVVAAVGLLAVAAIRILSDDGGGDIAPVNGDDQPEVVDTGGARPLSLAPMSDAEKARARHNNPWPYGDFADDISSLLRPGRREVMFARDAAETEIAEKITEHKLTIRLENVRVGDVVAVLAREFEPLGIPVYEGLPKVSDGIVFKRVYLTDVTIQQVISYMAVQSDLHVFSAITPLGMCIGSQNACDQAYLDAKAWEADARAEFQSEPDDFLDTDYRPDVRGSSLGRLVRDIREKTGIDVVIGPRAWQTGVVFTWVADPLPLRDALDQIARRLGARVYVKGGRAFVLVG